MSIYLFGAPNLKRDQWHEVSVTAGGVTHDLAPQPVPTSPPAFVESQTKGTIIPQAGAGGRYHLFIMRSRVGLRYGQPYSVVLPMDPQ